MAGRGTRFRDAGHDVPKYRIRAHGRSLFHWSVSSLSGYAPVSRAVFVARREDDAGAFVRDECATLGLPEPVLVELDADTDGQATSALLGMDACDAARPVAIFNIDTHVRPGAMTSPAAGVDGHLPCFRAPGEHWSFARTDAGGRVVEVREKQRISPLATVGLYWFGSPALYRDAYRRTFPGGGAGFERGEAYVAPLYNALIAAGGTVTVSELDPADVVPLGTPAELERFVQGAPP